MHARCNEFDSVILLPRTFFHLSSIQRLNKLGKLLLISIKSWGFANIIKVYNASFPVQQNKVTLLIKYHIYYDLLSYCLHRTCKALELQIPLKWKH